MPMHHPLRRTSFRTSSLVALALLPALLTGCSANSTAASSSLAAAALPAMVAGNWQFSSSAGAAARLSKLSGTLSGSSAAMTGMLHSQAATACVAPAEAVAVSGSADRTGLLTLTGPLSGGTLTITGTLSSDGRSLTEATYNVAGGSCGFATPAIAMGQVYTPISGMYAGVFNDGDGQIAAVQATLNQSADADGDGNYTLSGSATPNNACFSAAVPISNTEVTGGTFTFTYTDPTTKNSVIASGTFSSDASILTVTQWISSGPCGADTGTGTMTRQ